MKKGAQNLTIFLLLIVLIGVFSFGFVSASLFGDFWSKITGNVVYDSENIALNKPVTEDTPNPGSSYNRRPASYAVDGNVETSWTTGSLDSASLTINLESEYKVKSYEITCGGINNGNDGTIHFYDSNMEEIATKTYVCEGRRNSGEMRNTDYGEFSSPINVMSVKIDANSPYWGDWIMIHEFQLFGSAESPCAPKTCSDLVVGCGSIDNGCGDTIDCGSCGNGEICNEGVCEKEACVPKTCLDLSVGCGSVNDGCGNLISCGSCESGEICTEGKCVASSYILEIEAESGSVKRLSVLSRDDASGEKYLKTRRYNSGTATYHFRVPSTGDYYIWGRVVGTNDWSDSFYFSVDGDEDIYDVSEAGWSYDWRWSMVNGRGDKGRPNTLNPRVFSLDAGEHTLVIRGRETNSMIDKFVITNNLSFNPDEGSNNLCVSDCEGKQCGSDGCGGSCGSCKFGESCNDGICENTNVCTPKTCLNLDVGCGSVDDGCGNTLNCGSCGSGKVCNSGVCEEVACVPKTCEEVGKQCGNVDDGCGNTLNCGTCGDRQECYNGECKCTTTGSVLSIFSFISSELCCPYTCSDLGTMCGSANDGCGNTLNCGSCGNGEMCSNGNCICVPLTCSGQQKECGSLSDGCGNTLNCGICDSGKTCTNGKCVTTTTTGKTYYVSTTGSDSNDGSLEHPFKTITYGAGKLNPGETLYVRGGTYNQVVKVSKSGNSNSPITIAGYPSEEATIDGNYNLPSGQYDTLLTVSGNYVVVKDLAIKRSYGRGLTLSGTNDRADNIFSYQNMENGILVSGNYGIVENSRIWSNAMSNVDFSQTRGYWAGGLNAARSPSHATLRNNTVWNNWGEGLSTFESEYTTIEDNTVYDNLLNVYISDTANAVVQRNLIYCTPGNSLYRSNQGGIAIADETYDPVSSDNTIINNIIMGCSINIDSWGGDNSGSFTNLLIAHNTLVNAINGAGIDFRNGKHTNVRIENNIVVQDNSKAVASLSNCQGVTFSNNLWSKTPPSSVSSSGDVVADPKLSKSGSSLTSGGLKPDYFKLLAGSPAIDKAKNLGISEDFFKNTRPSGNGYDFGANEYTSSSSCTLNCAGKNCGSDGCGGSCGTCSSDKTCTNGVCVSTTTTTTGRDKYLQPFSSDSIWNMPIGSNAVYVAANIPAHKFTGFDEDIIVMTPDAPLRDVWTNNAGWSTTASRCTESKSAGFSVPIPDNFVIGDERPSTPNYAGAILLSDGRTISQFQPVARCTAGGRVTYTSGAKYDDEDIYGEGITGAHGGAGLSSIGGTIRVGELLPDSPPMKHALKVVLWGDLAISSSGGTYRWPAQWADSCSPSCYKGSVPALKMGALLALKPDFNINSLETEPAKKIAWTLQNYGAYLVDNSGWSGYYFAAEKGPAGDVFTEFADAWGFTPTGVKTSDWNRDWNSDSVLNTQTAWGRDMNKIFTSLYVIDNNGPNSVGGGGTPLQPLAPELT